MFSRRVFCKKNSLVKAGFVIYSEKSILEPVQKLEWIWLFLGQ